MSKVNDWQQWQSQDAYSLVTASNSDKEPVDMDLTNRKTKNKIDILCCHHRIQQDVTVIGKAFSMGSDHQLIQVILGNDAKDEKLCPSYKGQQKTTFNKRNLPEDHRRT